MFEVGVLEAKTRLSALLEAVEQGREEVVITRHGRAVARLVAVDAAERPSRLPAAELAASSKRLREAMALRNPDLGDVGWDELKAMMHQ